MLLLLIPHKRVVGKAIEMLWHTRALAAKSAESLWHVRIAAALSGNFRSSGT